MVQVIRLLVTLALASALAGLPALAQEIRINPLPPHVKPQWTPMPEVPKVYYAPNLPTDVFRYQGKYYFFWEGYLYRSGKPSGPWKSMPEVPDWFYGINPAYFKTVKKEGAPAPPPSESAAPATPAPETPPAESAPATPAPPETAPEGAAPPPPKVM
jgi:hypothetical protein